jgi:hypothetical protein
MTRLPLHFSTKEIENLWLLREFANELPFLSTEILLCNLSTDSISCRKGILADKLDVFS